MDEATIRVGLWYYDSAATNATLAALNGNPNATFSADLEAAARAVVDAVNALGGIAGREVIPVLHRVDIANLLSASGAAEEQERACAAFTQDNEVFALQAMASGFLVDCGLRTGTAVMNDVAAGGYAVLDQSLYERYESVYFGPNAPLAEQREVALVETLWEQGFFTEEANTRVGIIVDNWAGSQGGVENGLVPALAGHGIPTSNCTTSRTGGCVMQIVYPDPIQSNWANYILQLQSAGVTHVVFAMTRSVFWAPTFMMKAAESQQYRPRWALGSDQTPDNLFSFGSPSAQLRNTSGVGWLPEADTGDTTPVSENDALCDQIGTESGQGVDGVRVYCDSLFLLKHVLDRAPEVSLAGMDAALGNVASGYPSVNTIRGLTEFRPGDHHGAIAFQSFGYNEGCSRSTPCFRYTSDPRSFP